MFAFNSTNLGSSRHVSQVIVAKESVNRCLFWVAENLQNPIPKSTTSKFKTMPQCTFIFIIVKMVKSKKKNE